MKKRYKLGIIGCGFMAHAILRGVVLSDYLSARKIIVSDCDELKLKDVNEELGVEITSDNRKVAAESEYVLFAIKPQNFEDVAAQISDVRIEKVISIMAGLKRSYIKNALGVGLIKVARCMPNLPCISGSGPAYVFMFIDALTDAGVKHGLTRDEASTLAAQTVFGAAEMVQHSEEPIEKLIESVCSKGGTTIEAVKSFEENNFRGIIGEAVDACVARSKELSKR